MPTLSTTRSANATEIMYTKLYTGECTSHIVKDNGLSKKNSKNNQLADEWKYGVWD